jgi:hypothetical protein
VPPSISPVGVPEFSDAVFLLVAIPAPCSAY